MVRELKLTCPKCGNEITIRADKGVFPATVKCSKCGAIFEKAHDDLGNAVENMAIPTKKCWMCGELVYIADFILAVAMKEAGEISEFPKKPTCRKCLIKISQYPSISVKTH